MPSHTEIGEFIWRIADHLRGDYEKNDNEDVILPFTLLRRLDCVLEKTRDKVRETETQVAGKVTDDVLKKLLVGAAGVPFYNRSKFSFAELLKDAANIKDNFGAWLEGFSDNIKEILYNFSGGEEKGLAPIYETLARKNLLYLITKEFASEDLDLHPDRVTNHEMGLIYEYLIRKFKEGAAAGEQYTPRDVVQLLVQLVFADVEHTLKSAQGSLVGIYDPAVGTGGIVTVSKEYLTTQWGLDPTNVFIYGQELREKTYAICKADALMKSTSKNNDDSSRIKQGNTLSNDQLQGQQFNFMMANPEFGTDWKKIEDVIRKEADRGYDGRFGAGLPEVGDASFLFLQHMISKMTPVDKGGSVIGIVFNGSPLFSGDAGSGWSNIRKWIITNDWLDAIVALPEDMFYNTNIATYLWIVRNNKPVSRRGRILLINGNQDRFYSLLRQSLGDKRVELTPSQIAEIVDVYRRGKPVTDLAQVFDLEDFGYTRIIVERPLRLRFEITEERLAAFRQAGYFSGLVLTKKVGDKAKDDIKMGEEKQRAILAALEKAKVHSPCLDDRSFQQAINDALPFKAAGQLVTALRAAFGTPDERAEKVLLKPLEADFNRATADADPGGWYATDSALREEERVPLKIDIQAYFAVEVLPYAADAWMDRSKDKVGCGISFSRYFPTVRTAKKMGTILKELHTNFDLLKGLESERQRLSRAGVSENKKNATLFIDSKTAWLGKVPSHWKVVPLFSVLRERKVPNLGNAEPNLLSLSYGRIVRRSADTNFGLLPKSFETYQIVQPGNIVLRLLDLQNDKKSLRVGLVEERGIVTSAYLALEVVGDNNPAFLALLLHSYDLKKVFYSLGGGVRQSIGYSDIRRLPVALPALDEQIAIVGEIGTETTRVDSLLAHYRREIETLKDYRTEYLVHSVTGAITVDED